MNFSAVDKTVLVPKGRSVPESTASPIKFTEELQNGAALRVRPQGWSLLRTLGFETQDEVPGPDFYMLDGQGKKLSESYQMFMTEKTPEDNPGVLVKLPNLEKYGTSMYLMDRKSEHLYTTGVEGYKQIDEKGLLYPSESMVVAGTLEENRGKPMPFIQDSKIQGIPTAESTRVPLKTSTEKREAKEQKEPLTPNQLLEIEQTILYKKELEEAEEAMVQAYLEKSRLEKEETEIIKQRALKAQEEFEALEQRRDENKRINEKMREEIKKMEQAVASSSSFIKNLKREDQQQASLNKTISNFCDTSDVPPDPTPTNIASYPSLGSLNEEKKEELIEAEYEYYNLKRAVLVEKMTVANEIYLAHLQNYKQEDPRKRSQKYLLQFNELIDKLNQQFETVVAMLNLPFEESLMTYPSLEYVMDIVQQEDLSDKSRDFFQELIREVDIKNVITQKVSNNRLAIVGTSEEEAEVNLQHKEYQKESFRLLRFCRRMIEKKDKEVGYIEFDQPEGVPDVKPNTEKELDQKLREALIEPQQVKPAGGNIIPPHYSREMSPQYLLKKKKRP